MDKRQNAETFRVQRKRRVLRCSIDPGVKLNRSQLAMLEEEKRRGGRPHPGMAIIAGSAQFREAWDDSQFGPSGVWPRRLHKTPAGTYFWLTGGSLSGAYLRQDGSHRSFDGSYMAPIYCISCGRADKSADRLCTRFHRVPQRLLRTLTIRNPRRYEQQLREARDKARFKKSQAELIHEAVVRNGGWFGRVTLEAPPTPPAPPQPRKRPGPIERAFGAVLTFVWNRVKFLAILTLLGLAAGGR